MSCRSVTQYVSWCRPPVEPRDDSSREYRECVYPALLARYYKLCGGYLACGASGVVLDQSSGENVGRVDDGSSCVADACWCGRGGVLGAGGQFCGLASLVNFSRDDEFFLNSLSGLQRTMREPVAGDVQSGRDAGGGADLGLCFGTGESSTVGVVRGGREASVVSEDCSAALCEDKLSGNENGGVSGSLVVLDAGCEDTREEGVGSGGLNNSAQSRGKHYSSNKRKRERAKARRGEGGFGGSFRLRGVQKEERVELQATLHERWIAENKLRTSQARRRLELLEAQDIGKLKKRQETKLMRDTESNKVAVEKAFATLARTGNMPGVPAAGPGCVETVVTTPTLSSGSISPNSSVSMAEVHAMQKENLAFKKKEEERASFDAKLEKCIETLRYHDPKMAEVFSSIKGDVAYTETTGETLSSDPEIAEIQDYACNYGHSYIGSDGRLHTCKNDEDFQDDF